MVNCENIVAVGIDKSVFDADKDVLLVTSFVVAENSPLYSTLELKDSILILEETLLQVMQNDDECVLGCGNLNTRTGCEQPKLEEIVSYMPGSEVGRVSKSGKSLPNVCFMQDCVFLSLVF